MSEIDLMAEIQRELNAMQADRIRDMERAIELFGPRKDWPRPPRRVRARNHLRWWVRERRHALAAIIDPYGCDDC